MSSDFDIVHWLNLTMVPGVSQLMARKLLRAFESPGAVLRAKSGDLQQHVPTAVAEKIKNSDVTAATKNAMQWLEGEKKQILTVDDKNYPRLLLELSDAPLLLFVHGDETLLNKNIIAIVGSRNASSGGAKNAEIFSRSLSDGGFCVVSGMAQGIDTAAHKGALQGATSTIAVIGTGIDQVYPKENRYLAEKIIANGVMISEFPLGASPHPKNFPRRNRIISGISHACLVVEATIKSGSLITARLAAEQGREVFAVPGSINSPMYRGCHALIKQGAKLAENINDILEEICITSSSSVSPAVNADEMTAIAADKENELLAHIDFTPTTIDEIAQKSQIAVDTLLSALLELEVTGKIAIAPGGKYQRLP